MLLLATFLGLFAITARQFPLVLYATVAPFPSVIATPLRGAIDHAVMFLAPVREGLAWIDIGDPRARKADRLPVLPDAPAIATATTRGVVPGR